MAIGLACEGEQRADTAIVFAADGNYLRYAAFAAAQIAALAPERRFDICLCTPADARAGRGPRRPRRPPRPGRHRRHLRPARAGPAAHRGGLPAARAAGGLRRRLPAAALPRRRRLRAGRRLRGAARRSTSGRIRWRAVRDNIQWRTPGRRPDSFRRLGLGPAPVFNSGVLLIDVAAFNAAGRAGALPRLRRQPLRRRGSGSTRTCSTRCCMAAGPRSRRSGTGSTPGRRGSSRRWRTRTSCTSSGRRSPGRTRGASCRCASAAPTAVLRRAFPRGADRRGRGGADGEPRLPAAEPRQASSLRAQDVRLPRPLPDRPHRPPLISTSAGPAG